MHYAEFPPDIRLASVVHRIWTLEGRAGELERAEPILPDGRPELLLHAGDAFERLTDRGGFERQARILFAGQLPSQLVLRPTGPVAVVGIRLHAYGAASLLGVPQHELAGRIPDVEAIAPALHHALCAALSGADGFSDIVPRVQETLLRYVAPLEVDARVRAAADTIYRRRGHVSIDGLARVVNLSRRHLERRFLDTVGLTPKRLARIARFQHALACLEQYDAAPGTRAAAECGYADQAHFIRDFRTLAGCSPSEHLLRRSALTGFFVDRS